MAITPVYICPGKYASTDGKYATYPTQTVTTITLERDAYGRPVLDKDGNPNSTTKTSGPAAVTPSLAEWGVAFADYKIDLKTVDSAGNVKTKQVDFQDLLIVVSEQRAAAVEEQIEPMSVRMSTRNRKLDQLGAALSIIADIQAKFTKAEDTDSKTSSSTLTADSLAGLALVGYTTDKKVGENLSMDKSTVEYYQQMLKTKLDSLNNASSKDMTRLQSLVDKRDESYSTATSLMQAVADTRANTIKNM